MGTYTKWALLTRLTQKGMPGGLPLHKTECTKQED